MLDDPGTFERIANACDCDREFFGHLTYEQGLALSNGLLRVSLDGGEATDGELRLLALELATTSLAVLAMLGYTAPLAAVRQHGIDRAAKLEAEAAAA